MGTLISVEAAHVSVSDFAESLSSLRKIPVTVESECAGVLIPQVKAQCLPLSNVLDRICQPLALSWRVASDGIVIEPAADFYPTIIN